MYLDGRRRNIRWGDELVDADVEAEIREKVILTRMTKQVCTMFMCYCLGKARTDSLDGYLLLRTNTQNLSKLIDEAIEDVQVQLGELRSGTLYNLT